MVAALTDPETWTALFKIAVINVVLSGDNALVIALACRSLPPRDQKRAFVVGTAGIVVLMTALTSFAALLMTLPYIQIIGSLLLLWIGVKLLLPENDDGNVIRLAFPPLTEERRKELVKTVHHRAEEGRVAVRNVRRHSKEELEKLERDSAISEDDLKRAEKELQKLTDQSVAEIDEIQRHKEQELMEV